MRALHGMVRKKAAITSDRHEPGGNAMNFDIGFGGAFIAGLLSFLSPCVLPIVPPSLAFIAGVSFQDIETGDARTRFRVLRAAIAFVLGFTTVFVILGMAATTVGRLLNEYRDTIAMLAGGLIVLLGLHFLGIFRIALLYREARVHTRSRPLGVIGAYVAGLAFAFGWSPCVGPVLSTILVVAGGQETALQGGLLLLLYALGLGLPFIIAAAFLEQFRGFLMKFRRHMGLVEKVIGVFLVIAGVFIATGWVNDVANWILETFPSLALG